MDLECLEGKLFGARYYTVQPQLPEMYHQVQQTWNNMIEWCVETFGPTPIDGIWTPGSRWYTNNAKFWFRNEADRTLFVLKWQ